MSTRKVYKEQLAFSNVQQIGKQITELLAGKLFTVATMLVQQPASSCDRIEVRPNQYLTCDWTDHADLTLVRVETDKEYASLHFSDGHYSYIFLSRLPQSVHPECVTTALFNFFERDSFSITERVADGVRHTTFRVQGEMEVDSDEINEKYLKAHLKAVEV